MMVMERGKWMARMVTVMVVDDDGDAEGEMDGKDGAD